MDNIPKRDSPPLTWANVALALSFVAFDAILSSVYRLGISSSLVSAALRCVIQLSVMALVLESIFNTKNPYGIGGLAREFYLQYPWSRGADSIFQVLLNLLGTLEIGKWEIASSSSGHLHPYQLRTSAREGTNTSWVPRTYLHQVSADLMIKFYTAFVAMFCSTAPVCIIGTRFGMSVVPFWTPEQFSEP